MCHNRFAVLFSAFECKMKSARERKMKLFVIYTDFSWLRVRK